jgi:hypothetical protein
MRKQSINSYNDDDTAHAYVHAWRVGVAKRCLIMMSSTMIDIERGEVLRSRFIELGWWCICHDSRYTCLKYTSSDLFLDELIQDVTS